MPRNQPVPVLRLAPRILQELSPLRIGDYWLLFRWIFWFPQALTDYSDRYIRGDEADKNRATLVVMTFVLTLLIILAVVSIQILWLVSGIGPKLTIGATADLSIGAILLAMIPVGLVVAVGLSRNWLPSLCAVIPMTALSSYIAMFALLRHIQTQAPGRLEETVSFFLLGGSYGLLYSLISASLNLGMVNPKRFLIYALLLSSPSVLLAIAGIYITPTTEPISFTVVAGWMLVACLCSVTGFILVGIRIDDWLMGQVAWDSTTSYLSYVPHVTLLSIHQAEVSLNDWLQRDWKVGLINASGLWVYTRQRRAVADAILNTVRHMDERFQVERVTELTQISSYPWNPIWFLPGGEPNIMDMLDRYRNQRPVSLRMPDVSRLKIEYPADAVIATVVALESGDQEQASAMEHQKFGPQANSRVLGDLLQALEMLERIPNVVMEPALELPTPSRSIRKISWGVVVKLYEIYRYAYLIPRCVSVAGRRRAQAEAMTHLGELYIFVNGNSQMFPMERKRICQIIKDWEDDVSDVRNLSEFHERSAPWIPSDPDNPFIYDEPLKRPALIRDRDEAYQFLRHAWQIREILAERLGPRTQIVEILGPALAGKTSLFLTTREKEKLGVLTVYVSLKHLNSDIPAEARIAYAICDELNHYGMAIPLDDDEIRREVRNEPYRFLEHMVRSICEQRSSGLIIGLDEFDHLERVVASGNQFRRFLRFMFHLCEMIPYLGLAIIGPLDHAARYDRNRPHTSRFARPIRIRCLSSTAVEDLLQRPLPNFYHRFSRMAVLEIMRLTNGHPYLVQLIAWSVVDRFNAAQTNDKRMGNTVEAIEPIFTETDVKEILDNELFKQGYHYYVNRLLADFGMRQARAREIVQFIYDSRNRPSLQFDLATIMTTLGIAGNVVETELLQELLSDFAKQCVLTVDPNAPYEIKIELLRDVDPLTEPEDDDGGRADGGGRFGF